MPTDSTQNSYYIDPDSASETARLINQAHMLTEAMGGPLADHKDITHIHDILDLACGPGEWVLELASRYPEKQVMGVDISQRMLEYAQLQALRNHRHNAHFREMDIFKQPLEGIVNLNFSLDEFSPPGPHEKSFREPSFREIWGDAPLSYEIPCN
ncbi:MAG TPA: class I SAM-dependent methyltransferase [Ktedonobacteraceae bacterium]|jgi:SAM-dependent methyltransferase